MVVFLFIALASTSFADDQWRTFCGDASKFAEDVMRKRQDGISAQKQMDDFFNATQKDTSKDTMNTYPVRLEGIAGIGLTFISAISDIEPNWDEVLFIS